MRRVSREQAPEERQKAAEMIKTKRTEHFARRSQLETELPEREIELAEKLRGLQELATELDRLNDELPSDLDNYLKIQKMKADLELGQKSYDELLHWQAMERAEQKHLLDNSNLAPKMQDAANLLDKFYAEQEKQWTESEVSKEMIIENFSDEHLASLSIEDYVLLLKRFPSNLVTHVTRQGIRDHVGMVYHTAGEGAYTPGFMKMLADGRLRSPLGVKMLEGEKDQAIAKYLGLSKCKNRNEPQVRLNVLSIVEGYADTNAIHFATEDVADHLYGSEKGNEIAIVYPSAFIASQYYFSGPSLAYGDKAYSNDQWVWASEEHGMDLAAGLIFIPGDAMVDAETGSRYALNEKNEPIINTDYQEKLRRVLATPDFASLAENIKQVQRQWNTYSRKLDDPRLQDGYGRLWDDLQPFIERLVDEFGITDNRLQLAMMEPATLSDMLSCNQDPNKINHVINETLKTKGILFKETKNPVPSQKFWENYLTQQPTKTPLKIVYYKGGDPTTAVNAWREQNGLIKRSTDDNLGFPERSVERDSPEATVGHDRFTAIAQKIFDYHYPVLFRTMINGRETEIIPTEEYYKNDNDEEIPPDPDDDNLPPAWRTTPKKDWL